MLRNRVEIMHGVNLDQLGRRDPGHYGTLTLAELPPPEFRRAAPLRAAGRSLVLTPASPADPLPELAAALLAKRYQTPSVWSAVVNGIPRVMVCDGLPDDATVEGLFHLNAPVWSEARPI